MPMLVGIHAEGKDHLVLHALMTKLLLLPEDEMQIDFIEAPGRGWQFVLEFIPKALKRFYGRCAQIAVVAMDNDGDLDLDQAGLSEDPKHPRHANHVEAAHPECRYCMVVDVVSRIRSELNWIPKKPGRTWPILVAVPVEMIETWLLILKGDPDVERRRRSIQKQRLYGKPVTTTSERMSVVLPLIHLMQQPDIDNLRQRSASFRDFHDQVVAAQQIILTAPDCW
jgi:hypothetical protein